MIPPSQLVIPPLPFLVVPSLMALLSTDDPICWSYCLPLPVRPSSPPFESPR